jgi:hypothetical protein
MTLRKSETILRLLIGLALGAGFVGFATHSHPASAATAALVVAGPAVAGPTAGL